MAAEYEAKVLDIDPAAMADLVVAKGGRRVGATALQRRHVYDIVAGDGGRWIRLRDNGSSTTLAVKRVSRDGIDGTDEVEVTVDDFATADRLLNLLGFRAKAYQENRRTSFVLDGGRLEIDEWPMIPPYLEIEADSPKEVLRIAGLLGYGEDELTSENTTDVYARYGIDLADHPVVRH
jgi:adenylate cyclase class 2